MRAGLYPILFPSFHNMLLRSQQINVAPWAVQQATISADATTAPDGSATADKLVEDGSAATQHAVVQTYITTAMTQYTASVYAKAAERTSILFYVGSSGVSGGDAGYYFNLSTGAVGAKVGAATPIAPSIMDAGGGWRRCILTFTTGADTTTDFNLYAADGTPSNTYNGDGASGVYFWGAQVRLGAQPGRYRMTTTVAL